jgi:hypothetical protein
MSGCQKCLLQEVNGFGSSKAETHFITSLNKLVDLNIVEKLKEKETNLTDSLYTPVINYRCNYCGERWSYSPSEKAWRGFFIRTNNIGKKILLDKRRNSIMKLGCSIFLMVILATALYFTFG